MTIDFAGTTGRTDGLPKPELKVPFPALEWIADVGLVKIHPGSPLGYLLTGIRRSSLEERHQAGLQFCRNVASEQAQAQGAGGVAAIDPRVRSTLSTIGSPLRRIRIASLNPTGLMMFNTNATDAVHAVIAHDGLIVGPRLHLSDLRERLLLALRSSPPSQNLDVGVMTAAAFTPFRLLWHSCGFSRTDTIPRKRVEQNLTASGCSASKAHDLCNGLVESGICEQRDGGFRLGARWRHWSKVLASEMVLEVESVSLVGVTSRDLISLSRNSKRVLLIGSPGARVCCSFTSIGFLAKHSLRHQPATTERTEPAVVMRYLTRELAECAVNDLLNLDTFGSVISMASGIRPQLEGSPNRPKQSARESKRDDNARTVACPRCGHPAQGTKEFCTKCGVTLTSTASVLHTGGNRESRPSDTEIERENPGSFPEQVPTSPTCPACHAPLKGRNFCTQCGVRLGRPGGAAE